MTEFLKDNKIRFADNKQDFEFTRRVDGIMFQKEKELKIEIITTNFSECMSMFHIIRETLWQITH